MPIRDCLRKAGSGFDGAGLNGRGLERPLSDRDVTSGDPRGVDLAVVGDCENGVPAGLLPRLLMRRKADSDSRASFLGGRSGASLSLSSVSQLFVDF